MLRRAVLIVAVVVVSTAAVSALLAVRYLRQLDALVVEKFNGRRWDFPSRIYSEPFLIYPGLDLEAAGFFERLERLNYRRSDGTLRPGDFRPVDTGLDLYLRDFAYPGQHANDRLVHLELRDGVVVSMHDRGSGEALYALQLEPEEVSGLYDVTWEQRREVTLTQLPPRLARAVVLTEDRRFYSHHGVDGIGILRALTTNLRAGELRQGGSTLTQQLIKNFLLTPERTVQRKWREVVMALLTERRYSKDEILENYLNEIYLGQNGLQSIHGVWEASRFYFGRTPEEISLGEIALLAGLIRAPNQLSPFRNPDQARARRDTVLRLLRDAGEITAGEYEAAVAEPLRVAPLAPGRNAAPYFVDFLRRDLTRNYPSEILTTAGLDVYTTLDAQLQQFAAAAVSEGLAALEQRHPRLLADPNRRVQAALIALRPQTGGIVAMVGGRDYQTSQFNRVTQAHRQPGSIFKPFVYLAAFEAAPTADDPITPASAVIDEPFEWRYDQRSWRPANYGDEYFGRVTVRRALELSLNAATARIAYRVGLDPVLDLAQRLGITSALPHYPSVVLGALEVTPFEVAQAYAVIANQGLRAAVRAANKVVDRHGQTIERRPLEVERVASPEGTYMVEHVMEGVLDRGTGQGVRERGFDRPAAGKTGTTNDGRDAWFAGFTSDLLAVVWVGFDDGEPLALTGAEAALPIWTAFMKRATAAAPPTEFPAPSGIALVRIDPYTGLIATPACPETLVEAFWRGQEPTAACPAHSPPAGASVRAPAPDPL